ncbi:hypothetical protein LAZ67_8001139 [Cordylochernes scorpioides]|uniref:Reverse transcriptase domain-containing protein n=1 Tax=Cordylochernes scorpioides TaxID=51811 RepID=A0ABY6KQR9_9ARAC|nr:hypothetical protein LAZ67_8001139 [Cordylochernes scorpioides]
MDCSIFKKVSARFGNEALKQARRFEKLRLSLNQWKQHLAFNHQCLSRQIIPPSLILKDPVRTNYSRKILLQTGKKLTNARIKNCHYNIHKIELNINALIPRLQDLIDDSHFTMLVEYIDAKCVNIRTKIRNSQLQKLNKWSNKPQIQSTTNDNVINLSKQPIPPEAISLLSKGLNFVPSQKLDIPRTIASIETSIKNLADSNKEKIRTEVIPILKNLTRQNKTNINHEERKAISFLKENNNIIISPSDKGKNTVIMDIADYDSKIHQLLQDKEIYELLTINPLQNIIKDFNRNLNRIKRTHKLDNKVVEKIRASKRDLPIFYGLPKIHKPNNPLRPIVSYTGSPIYPLAKYLSTIISPFQKFLPHTVQNATSMVEVMQGIAIPQNYHMVSFDVESLYTSIPHKEAISEISKCMDTNPQLNLTISKEALEDLLELCLSFSYFSYKNQYYKQIKGLPMGNPISSALANIYMNHIDNIIIATKHLKIIAWKRYIDDIICISENSNLDNILTFLNSGSDMEECEQREEELHTYDEILKIIKTGELYTLRYFSGGHGKGKLVMGFLCYKCRVREMRLRLAIV